MIKILYIILPFFMILCGGCALQSDVIYIDDRVDVLEQKLSKQSRVSGGTEKVLRAEYARLNNQFDSLHEKLNLIEGRFDEIEFNLNSQKEAVEALKAQHKKLASVSENSLLRLKNLETYTGYEPSSDAAGPKPGKAETVPGKLAVPVSSEVKKDDVILYEKAREALKKNQLKTARELFTRLMIEFPASNRADNAQFGVGESYYKGKMYKKAILAYQKVIETFPKGNKVPDAYFKQGLAFAELGEIENARIVLEDLIRKFPESNNAGWAKKKLDKLGK